MNKAITVEVQFFLISIFWGAILLLTYDGIRILRRLIKHNNFFLAIEDLIFWVVSSVLIFAMMYRENNGIIRGFSVVGMGIGMILYHYIVSEFVVYATTKFIQTLLRPIISVIQRLKKLLRFFLRKEKKLVNFLLIQLKKLWKSVKIALNKMRQKRILKREKRLIEKKRKNEKKRLKKKQKIEPEKKTKKNNENRRK